MKPEPAISARVAGLPISPTIGIQLRCNELARAGRTVRRLGLGQSPFPVPGVVVDALRANAHQKDYLPPAGLGALRDGVAEWLRRRTLGAWRADDIIIGPGSKELMFLTQVVFDGEVLIPTPAWVSYAPQGVVLGRELHLLPTRLDQGWLLQPGDLDAHCRAGGPRSRMLILNSPSNPTGNVYDAAQLEALADVARRHRIVVLSDEIYADLAFDGVYASIARAYPEGTIVSTGLSKWCGAGGWRLGIFALPAGLGALRDALIAVASETYTSTSAPIQHAATRAFQPDASIQEYLRSARAILAGLGQHAVRHLRTSGAELVSPRAAFYVFPDFEARRGELAARGIRGSAELAERLLEETGVATLPGVAFGRPPAELTLRLSLVDFDGATAQAACTATSADLDEAFLERWCAPTTTAIRDIVAWLR